MLFLGGVYVEARERLRLRRVKAPERGEPEALVQAEAVYATDARRHGRPARRIGL